MPNMRQTPKEKEIYQRTLEGIDISLDEFEDFKAQIQHKLSMNEIYWDKLNPQCLLR